MSQLARACLAFARWARGFTINDVAAMTAWSGVTLDEFELWILRSARRGIVELEHYLAGLSPA
jgi:hypothetical protein